MTPQMSRAYRDVVLASISARLPEECAQAAAQAAVSSAIREGRLQRASQCSICGVGGRWITVQYRSGRAPGARWSIQMHHWSYLPEHRLDVVGLCVSCHRRVHTGNLAEPSTGATLRTPRQLNREWRDEYRRRARPDLAAKRDARRAMIAQLAERGTP